MYYMQITENIAHNFVDKLVITNFMPLAVSLMFSR